MEKYIGIDISKESLQVHVPEEGLDWVVPNDLKGMKSLWMKLKKRFKKESQNLVFIFEATGSYSYRLKKFCAEKSVRCFIVNPRQSANFAKAQGERNKSDPIDARLLASIHVVAGPGQIKVPEINEEVELLKEYMSYYKFIQSQRTRYENQLESAQAKGNVVPLVRRLQKEVERLKREEQEILNQLKESVDASSELSKHFEHITSLKGVGDVAGLALLHLFLKYPDTNRKQIIALAGLDTVSETSGKSVKRKGKISKQGCKLYRSILFMPALISINHNAELRAMYARLKANGKHSTLAQIAIMRKIIIITHALFKNGEKYDETRYLAANEKEEEKAA